MVAATRIAMTDISRQKRYEAELGSEGFRRQNTVGQAIENYLDRVGIRDNGLRWTACLPVVNDLIKSRNHDVKLNLTIQYTLS